MEKYKKLLESYYVAKPEEWVYVIVNTLNLICITIVSNKFEGMDFNDRRKQILSKLQIQEPYSEGFLELYTVAEADEERIVKPISKEIVKLTSWQQLALNSKNNIKIKDSREDYMQDTPKIVSFYSYKGGVGRTVALTHVAYILASRGKKVAIVDMDIEAPGISSIFDPKVVQMPKYGLVDYLYDRMSKVDEIEKSIFITDIFSEANLSGINGRLFVVPAGTMNVDYISKIENLKANLIISPSNNYWKEFVDDLNRQVSPDIILVDSRTGINNWGALSLFTVSDNVIFFVYPNEENINGLTTIIKAMKDVGYNNYNVVFSRIHDDKIGRKRMEDMWNKIKGEIIGENEVDEITGEQLTIADPISIFYTPELAVADYFPVKSINHIFSHVANIIDEEIEDIGLINILSGIDRWKIISDLPYDDLGFAEQENSPFFQKTSYVDKFLDEDVSVVTGKKGTGKTKLYNMMLQHFDDVKNLSRANLDNVIPISGHGSFSSRPIGEFDYWAKLVSEGICSWDNIWRIYLLICLHKNSLIPVSRNTKYKRIRDITKDAKNDKLGWKFEYTEMVNLIAGEVSYSQLIQDYFNDIDLLLQQKGTKIWILYDQLDEDLEKKPYGKDAVEGLFKLIQSFEGRHIKNLKYKVFIRQDIWDRLSFTNKSHFKGKTIKLEWNKDDFLRLALKISFKSEMFRNIIGKYKPLPQNLDYMDIDALKDSLQILWGIRRESNRRSQYVVNWVYERLTDAEDNTFPRSLFMLLKGAKEQELTYVHTTNIQPPRDRLLRSASLNKGLFSASQERCEALKQEYDSYKEAFDLFSSFNDTFSYNDFCKGFNNTQWKVDELLDLFRKIGIISLKGEDTYKFAYIYIDGFKIKRTSKI